jgi:hypothetical protein
MYNLLREKLAQDKQSEEDASINSDDRSENDTSRSQVGIQESLKETPGGAAEVTLRQG